MPASRPNLAPLVAVGFGCAMLVGCSQAVDSASAGSSQDSIVAAAEHGADDAPSRIWHHGDDAAITAIVKAQLAGDRGLSALRIRVETAGGLVSLRGSAPSAEVRARATQIAVAVAGVGRVDNQLVVGQ